MSLKIGDRVKIKEEVLKDYFDSDIDTETEYIITNIVWSKVFEIKDSKADYTYNISEEYLTKVEENNEAKEFNNNDLCGRRFRIIYKSYKSILNKIPISECKITYIEGELLNFSVVEKIVLNDENYGFNIIPYESIIYMEEIVSK